MTPLNEAKAIALDIEALIRDLEAVKGEQIVLRHLAHKLQAHTERVLGVPAGSILPTPQGGVPKEPSDGGTPPVSS